MPKKSASARNAAQRNKQKAQKSVQLVHQTVQEKDTLEERKLPLRPDPKTVMNWQTLALLPLLPSTLRARARM